MDKKSNKDLIIFGFSLTAASLFALFCVILHFHAMNQVYMPIGTVTKEEAETAHFFGFVTFLGWFCALLTTPLWGILSFWWRKKRPVSLAFLFLTLTPIIFLALIIANARVSKRKVFDVAFTGAAQRSESLISAIELYRKKNGQYPEKLEELVPEFIEIIPQTGLAGYPEFKYHKADSNTLFKNYELFIETPSGLINWDMFVYWPEGHYPEHFYGGNPELFGKWAYVHE